MPELVFWVKLRCFDIVENRIIETKCIKMYVVLKCINICISVFYITSAVSILGAYKIAYRSPFSARVRRAASLFKSTLLCQ